MSKNDLPKGFDPDDIKAKKARVNNDDLRLQRQAQSIAANKKRKEKEKLTKKKSSEITEPKVKINKPKAKKVLVDKPKLEDVKIDKPKRPTASLPKPSDKKMPEIDWKVNKKDPKRINTLPKVRDDVKKQNDFKHPKKENSPNIPKASLERVTDSVGKGSSIANLKSASKSRYDAFVEKVNSISDIKVLKKMLYNRNYNIKKNFIKENPEVENLKYVIINDMRHIKKTTFDKVNNIKDPDKMLEVLRKLLIDNTRRVNKPKTVEDYSNREQDYIGNAIFSLQAAINSWDDDLLRIKVSEALRNITLEDIRRIFSKVPSYWAISEGYYYAVAEFDSFMEELFTLMETKDSNGNGISLTVAEKADMYGRLFKNDPTSNQ